MFFAATISASLSSPLFWNQPIDVVLYDLLVWFGWVPIVIILIWGFIQVWQVTRQEKYAASLKFVLLAIDVPPMTEQTPKALENMFSSLWGSFSNLTWKEKWIIGKFQSPFSFEIVSTEGYVQFYMRTQTRYRDVAEAGVYAAYPEAEITEVEDYASWAPGEFPNETWDTWGSELKLKKDEIFPLRTYQDFEDKISGEIKDPLGPILEQLAKMKPGEHFWIQIIIKPDGNDWKKAGENFIDKVFGNEKKHSPGMLETLFHSAMSIPADIGMHAFGFETSDSHAKPAQDPDMWKAFKITMAEKEQVEGVLKKIGKVGYKTKMRLVYIGKKGVYDKQARTAFVKGMFNQFSHLNLNALGLHGDATPKDDYFWQAWTYPARQGKLVRAFKNRSWGIGADPWILNIEELATLWHFPSITVKAPLVKKADAKRAEPPVGLPIGSDDVDQHSLPERPRAEMPSPVVSAHQARSSQEFHPDPSHGNTPVSGHEESAEPEIHLPGSSIFAPASRDRSPSHAVPARQVVPDEEGEDGLDATDMGPPADIELPGPPPGWVDEGAPPNLPV